LSSKKINEEGEIPRTETRRELGFQKMQYWNVGLPECILIRSSNGKYAGG